MLQASLTEQILRDIIFVDLSPKIVTCRVVLTFFTIS